jgi:hypothetical protein
MLRRYGVMMEPRLAMRALASEVIIGAGQLAIDRTISGVIGRLQGWHAGRALPRRVVPPDAIAEISLGDALRRRAARRRLLGVRRASAVDGTPSH